MTSIAFGSSVPMTIRSGRIKSSTAAPSFKNSGLETTLKCISTFLFFNSSATAALTLSPVPMGTVDLSTITFSEVIKRPIFRAASVTY